MAMPINYRIQAPSMGGYVQGLPSGASTYSLPRFTPEQQGILQSVMSQGAQGMQNLPSADFEPIKKMYETQFQQQIVPGLAEQFSGMGSGNQRSSAFQNALGGAGAGLSERLAGMQQQFNMQGRESEIARLMQMLGLGAQPQFEQGYQPAGPGFWASLGQGMGSSAGPLMQLMAALA